MTLDEIHALGVNDSIIHVDFMIGSDDLDITGICEDGTLRYPCSETERGRENKPTVYNLSNLLIFKITLR